MGAQQGYSKVTTNNLIFAYDTGDQRNSYKGKPGYNVAFPIVDVVGNNNIIYDSTHYFITTVGTETVNIPALGKYDNVRYATINNGYTGYGDGGNFNCCVNFFRFGSGANGTGPVTTGVTGNTVYTYSIIYKCESGYTSPNYMYRYEYNGAAFLGEVGIFDTSKRVDLGDGWYWAYNTFTTNAACNALYIGFWYYQYNTPDKIWIKDAMIVEGDYKIPPLNFLSGNQTRSVTQGLINLSNPAVTLDLTSVSFDSNARLTFDGTDDYIPLSPSIIPTSAITIELIYRNDNSGVNTSIIAGGAGQQDLNIHLPWGDTNVYWDAGRPFNRINKTTTNSERTGIHHWIFTKDSTTGVMSIYLDGNLWHTGTGLTSTIPTLSSVSLGCYDIGSGRNYYTTGILPVAKIYNKALTQAEITQNYNHYKTRFNLP